MRLALVCLLLVTSAVAVTAAVVSFVEIRLLLPVCMLLVLRPVRGSVRLADATSVSLVSLLLLLLLLLLLFAAITDVAEDTRACCVGRISDRDVYAMISSCAR